MYGAIIGDMVGAPYEFDRSPKVKDFGPLFIKKSMFTDDSVMTIAVADALIKAGPNADVDLIREKVAQCMKEWGNRYPHAGYGGRFGAWLHYDDPKPYGSWGNGSAMRVSSVGWLYDSMERTREVAAATAEVTHNHPEGIKGAEATAAAIFLARNGSSKEEIREYVTSEFGYDLSRTCDEIRPTYHHVESCQETVPEAITAFLEGEDFEDVIRTAVSLGGDCDTLTCIAGSIAEAFYGVPEEITEECKKRLPKDMSKVLNLFEAIRAKVRENEYQDSFLEGNELVVDAIAKYYADSSEENLAEVLEAIRSRMHADGHFLFPVDKDDDGTMTFLAIRTKDGRSWQGAFTSRAEYEKGAPAHILSNFIDNTLKSCMDSDLDGLIINPWGQSFLLAKELIQRIFDADGDVEYIVPDDAITEEHLDDGSFLKRAVEICNRNITKLNLIKLMRILRDSYVWVPCNAIMSDADNAMFEQMIKEAEEGDGLESMTGMEVKTSDEVRMVPDILQNGDDFFFPVFSSAEEMGEYGDNFSKVQMHFLEAANLARNNEKDVTGIVINAFSDPFVIRKESFELIADIQSSVEEGDSDEQSED